MASLSSLIGIPMVLVMLRGRSYATMIERISSREEACGEQAAGWKKSRGGDGGGCVASSRIRT